MGKSVLDAEFKTEIFRKDWPNVIAMRRQDAALQGARLKLEAGGYAAGQVVARNTSTKLFEKFSAVSGGSYDTVSVLFEDIAPFDQPTTGGALARIVTSGFVYKDVLLDYDASALSAREITDSSGVTVVKF